MEENDFFKLGVHFIENAYLGIVEKARDIEVKHGKNAKQLFLLGVASGFPKFSSYLDEEEVEFGSQVNEAFEENQNEHTL